MTDEQFDDLAKEALAFNPGPASDAVWSRVRPARVKWLPTIPEILACGSVCALALLFVGFWFLPKRTPVAQTNSVIEQALRDDPGSTMTSMNLMAENSYWYRSPMPESVNLDGVLFPDTRF